MFKLVSKYEPNGDQPEAIKELVDGVNAGVRDQVLLGATGTGKTFTIANVIAKTNRPTLVLAHNKTLAGQLYSELKELFPVSRLFPFDNPVFQGYSAYSFSQQWKGFHHGQDLNGVRCGGSLFRRGVRRPESGSRVLLEHGAPAASTDRLLRNR